MTVYFIAAASYQPPYLSALPRHSFWGQKNGGFNFLKPPHGAKYRHGKSTCPAAVFFFSASGQTWLYWLLF